MTNRTVVLVCSIGLLCACGDDDSDDAVADGSGTGGHVTHGTTTSEGRDDGAGSHTEGRSDGEQDDAGDPDGGGDDGATSRDDQGMDTDDGGDDGGHDDTGGRNDDGDDGGGQLDAGGDGDGDAEGGGHDDGGGQSDGGGDDGGGQSDGGGDDGGGQSDGGGDDGGGQSDGGGDACEVHETPLLAGQSIDVGWVVVETVGDELTIAIEMWSPWALDALHVYAGPGPVPSSNGTYVPGQFPWHFAFDPAETEALVAIPAAQLEAKCGDPLEIAVHAEVHGSDGEETAWAEGPFAGFPAWGMYFELPFCCE